MYLLCSTKQLNLMPIGQVKEYIHLRHQFGEINAADWNQLNTTLSDLNER